MLVLASQVVTSVFLAPALAKAASLVIWVRHTAHELHS